MDNQFSCYIEKHFTNQVTSTRRKFCTIILVVIHKWNNANGHLTHKKNKICKSPISIPSEKIDLYMFTCNTFSSIDIKSFPLNSIRTMCYFLRYGTKFIWSDLQWVKIFYFHDEDKSWWSSVLYHGVNVLMLTTIYAFWFWYSHNFSSIVLSCKIFISLIFNLSFCFIYRKHFGF